VNVREIVKAWLKKHGYDGLHDPDGWCACLADNPLCEEEMCAPGMCVPGYKVACPGPGECEIASNLGVPCDWHIGPKRREAKR
jgi:hypothetical protein